MDGSKNVQTRARSVKSRRQDDVKDRSVNFMGEGAARKSRIKIRPARGLRDQLRNKRFIVEFSSNPECMHL